MRTNRFLYNAGYTLAELMIVVAVIGVLAAIAYPSYQYGVRKARRADAQTVMMELAQWMERFYTENHRYDQARDATPVTNLHPTKLKQSPQEGSTKFYNIQLLNLSSTTYTIQADPINAHADDKCGKLILRHTGQHDVAGAYGGATVDDCWSK